MRICWCDLCGLMTDLASVGGLFLLGIESISSQLMVAQFRWEKEKKPELCRVVDDC